MTKRDISLEILDGIREIRAHKRGDGRLKVTELSEPSPPQVIRSQLRMSQSTFAGMLGVSMRTLQDWEQGRRVPQGPAVALLRIAEQHPDIFTQLH